MNLGIVGSEAAKFTPETEAKARDVIKRLLRLGTLQPPVTKVVSGGCHLGGIDIWAVEEAKKLGIATVEHKPKALFWPEYKARNLLIVRDSDKVVCITVKTLPPNYVKRGFENFCYHCKTDQHIKSGGCWTMHQARKQGKDWQLIVID